MTGFACANSDSRGFFLMFRTAFVLPRVKPAASRRSDAGATTMAPEARSGLESVQFSGAFLAVHNDSSTGDGRFMCL